MTPTVCVVVPWRERGNWLRRANLVRLTNHLRREASSWPVILADVELREWSPGRARNSGVMMTDADVIVFNDADTLVIGEQMRAAVAEAWTTGSLVYAYDLYLRLDEHSRVERELYNPPSMGCAAIRHDVFAGLHGFDEDYVGWGYEDIAFAQKCADTVGVRRITGPATHLWHGDRRDDDSPTDSDPEQVERNRARWLALTV